MQARPISSQERITSIDVIRGFALIGIFLVNMPIFHSPQRLIPYPDYSGIDYYLDLFLQMFVQTKFYTTFSFLFGLGFYLFMRRAEEKGLAVNRLFSRRLLILFSFGMIHLFFFWYGDILHTYALTGFFLLLFYKRTVKTLLLWALSLIALFYLIVASQFFIPEHEFATILEQVEQENMAKLTNYMAVYQNGAYWDWFAYRLDIEILPQIYQLPLVMLPILGMFLIGLAAGKIGIFQPDSPHRPKIKVICLYSFLFGLPLAFLVALLKIKVLDYGIYQETAIFFFTGLSGVALCLFYMSAFMLLLEKERWQKRLLPLKSFGQMALSNYLGQTFISVIIFQGFNVYGKVSLSTGTLMALLILLIQIIFSSIWTKHFHFGPMEWLWRSLTYGYFQPLKRKNQGMAVSDDRGFYHK